MPFNTNDPGRIVAPRNKLATDYFFTSPLGERSTLLGRVRGPLRVQWVGEGPLTRLATQADLSPKGRGKNPQLRSEAIQLPLLMAGARPCLPSTSKACLYQVLEG